MSAKVEITKGERFAFGQNWSDFLVSVDQAAVDESKAALTKLFRTTDLTGLSFLDVGSGSGLSSLAARAMGMRVTSFDFDPQSVECTRALKSKFFPDDPDWQIMPGSATDSEFLKQLGTYDVVYSWGVLHHTGQMMHCLEVVTQTVAANGRLMIALYNDQGPASIYWRWTKIAYNKVKFLRPLLLGMHAIWPMLPNIILNKLRGRNPRRGMRYWTDLKDWVGGYPFEVSKPGDIVDFYVDRGFLLEGLTTVRNRMGCNEYVFRRVCSDTV